MTVAELIALRRSLDFTQAQMAARMGLGARSYQDIEAADRDADVRERHQLLAEAVAFLAAAERGDFALSTPRFRAAALDIARLIRG